MAKEIIYPSQEKIIEYNLLALTVIKVKRADQPKVLNPYGIAKVIDDAKQLEGDVYDKAVVLLKGIIQSHPFASGNRRTAFIVAKEFLVSNSASLGIKDNPIHARAMQGICENYYTNDEIKRWIKNGKIRGFTG